MRFNNFCSCSQLVFEQNKTPILQQLFFVSLDLVFFVFNQLLSKSSSSPRASSMPARSSSSESMALSAVAFVATTGFFTTFAVGTTVVCFDSVVGFVVVDGLTDEPAPVELLLLLLVSLLLLLLLDLPAVGRLRGAAVDLVGCDSMGGAENLRLFFSRRAATSTSVARRLGLASDALRLPAPPLLAVVVVVAAEARASSEEVSDTFVPVVPLLETELDVVVVVVGVVVVVVVVVLGLLLALALPVEEVDDLRSLMSSSRLFTNVGLAPLVALAAAPPAACFVCLPACFACFAGCCCCCCCFVCLAGCFVCLLPAFAALLGLDDGGLVSGESKNWAARGRAAPVAVAAALSTARFLVALLLARPLTRPSMARLPSRDVSDADANMARAYICARASSHQRHTHARTHESLLSCIGLPCLRRHWIYHGSPACRRCSPPHRRWSAATAA
jgi:hypothetical protein